MRCGVVLPNFGEFHHPAVVAELAAEVEAHGWDGLFLWDHLRWEDQPVGDPWVCLAAAATATSRIRLGTLVTPLPRRRPWVLARQTVSLDQLSAGRLVLGVGIGGDWFGEYSAVGEPSGQRLHAEMLDEALQVLTGLWSGAEVDFDGRHYRVKGVAFAPTPVQRPRIPIWVGGTWPMTAPFRRAARWEGVAPIRREGTVTVDDYRRMLELIAAERGGLDGFEVVKFGSTTRPHPEAVEPYRRVGVTWWLEHTRSRATVAEMRRRIRLGPSCGDTG